jgi:anaerobic magnesium-protoporphyrin IX monomethyl ester cyclase
MSKKALLINPPTGNYIRDDRCQVPAESISSALRAPMDLLYYATILERQGFRCLLRDYPAEGRILDDYLTDLMEFRPDILVVSVTTPTLTGDLACVATAKKADPRLLTVAKGAHLAVDELMVMEACPALDIAIRQEAEKAIGEIITGKPLREVMGITFREGENVIRNPGRPQIIDLDWLPLPDRRLLKNELYVRPDTGERQATILAARGCPMNCIFCLVKVVTGQAVSQRSPRSIVEEIGVCVRDFQIRNFYFRADTFTWDRAWVMETCDLILAAGLKVNWVCNSRVNTLDEEMLVRMKQAGCWMIGLGIESGSQMILDKIKKGITVEAAKRAVRLCRRHGVKTYNFFVLGFPWDDENTIKETMDLAVELDSDFVEFHSAYPFPGTEFHEMAQAQGLFEPGSLIGQDVMSTPVRTLHLGNKRLRTLRRRATRKYYLRPSYMYKTLCRVESPKVLLNYLRKGFNLLFRV